MLTKSWHNYGGFLSISNSGLRIKTYVSGNTWATNSPMHVRNSTSHDPNTSWAKEGPNNIHYNNATGGLIIANGPAPQACLMSAITPPLDSNEIVLVEETYMYALEQSTTEMDSLALLEASEVIKEMTLYEHLDEKPELCDSSQVLEDFYDDRTDENIGLLREMDKAIENKDFIEAELKRDQVIADNIIEQGYKSVLNLILKHEKGTLTPADSTQLIYWATECSYLYGKTVSLAQNAYNAIYRESRWFDENCAPGMQRSIGLEGQEANRTLQLTLYPNPSTDWLYVRTNDPHLQSANCVIHNLDGREVYSGPLDFKKGLSLHNLALASGVYRVTLTVVKTQESFNQQFMYLNQ